MKPLQPWFMDWMFIHLWIRRWLTGAIWCYWDHWAIYSTLPLLSKWVSLYIHPSQRTHFSQLSSDLWRIKLTSVDLCPLLTWMMNRSCWHFMTHHRNLFTAYVLVQFEELKEQQVNQGYLGTPGFLIMVPLNRSISAPVVPCTLFLFQF